MFEQKVDNDTIKPSGIGGEIEVMADLGLNIRLEIRRAAEISTEGLVEGTRAVATADEEVVLAHDGEGGTPKIWCILA